jgi:hypothetical protein
VLSTSKVLAGGLAAAATAVLGSTFGAFGTVGGAAAGSVVSALTAEFVQRSMDRTADRLRRRTGRDSPDGRQPADGPVQTRGLSTSSLLLGSFLIFMLAIGAVTWTEYLTGSPLSGGDHGTTISHLAHLDVGTAVGDLLDGSDSGKSSGGGLVGKLLGG